MRYKAVSCAVLPWIYAWQHRVSARRLCSAEMFARWKKRLKMWMTSRSRDAKGLRQCGAQADAMDGADDPDAVTSVESAPPGTDVSTSTSGRPAEEAVQKSGEKGALRRCAACVALLGASGCPGRQQQPGA